MSTQATVRKRPQPTEVYLPLIEKAAAKLGDVHVTFNHHIGCAELVDEEGVVTAQIMCIDNDHGGHLTVVYPMGEDPNEHLMSQLKAVKLPRVCHGKHVHPPAAT